MNDRNGRISRRDALRIAVGVGAGLALCPRDLWASPASWNDLQTASLVTKPIPSTGERLPVIGIGTARRYNVAASEAGMAPLREVVRNFTRMGGKLIDTAPSYGKAEPVVGSLVAEAENRNQLFLATKVGRGRWLTRAGRREMEQSLKQLKVDKVDLMQVHNLAGVNRMLPVLRERTISGPRAGRCRTPRHAAGWPPWSTPPEEEGGGRCRNPESRTMRVASPGNALDYLLKPSTTSASRRRSSVHATGPVCSRKSGDRLDRCSTTKPS